MRRCAARATSSGEEQAVLGSRPRSAGELPYGQPGDGDEPRGEGSTDAAFRIETAVAPTDSAEDWPGRERVRAAGVASEEFMTASPQ